MVQKREATISNARRKCCSRKLQNSKMKNMKAKFLVDKSKPMKMKYGNASQEEATIDKGYVVQPLFHKG
jgi:hypothetical protein